MTGIDLVQSHSDWITAVPRRLDLKYRDDRCRLRLIQRSPYRATYIRYTRYTPPHRPSPPSRQTGHSWQQPDVPRGSHAPPRTYRSHLCSCHTRQLWGHDTRGAAQIDVAWCRLACLPSRRGRCPRPRVAPRRQASPRPPRPPPPPPRPPPPPQPGRTRIPAQEIPHVLMVSKRVRWDGRARRHRRDEVRTRGADVRRCLRITREAEASPAQHPHAHRGWACR